MRDFPMFSTQNGVASLTLNQIPYTAKAYIKLQDTAEPMLLLEECVDFCKLVGAQRIFASGHVLLERYPLHTSIIRMSRTLEGMPDSDAALFPVTEKTLEQWRQLYNEKMKAIPNAVYFSQRDAENLLKAGNAYFVHKEHLLLGIGIAGGDTVDAVVAAQPGMGKEVLCALCHALSGDTVHLEVAHNNARAVGLYEKLGFLKTAEIARWYEIL